MSEIPPEELHSPGFLSPFDMNIVWVRNHSATHTYLDWDVAKKDQKLNWNMAKGYEQWIHRKENIKDPYIYKEVVSVTQR